MRSAARNPKSVEVLLVEDNAGDVRLLVEALRECDPEGRVRLHTVKDGVQALDYLRGRDPDGANRPLPQLLLLDLNLPRKNGLEVLVEIKADIRLRRLPVVVLTTSNSDQDVLRCYEQHANCYLVKPADYNRWLMVVRGLLDFWCRLVILPPH